MTMICTEYEALLDLYVDGELTTEELLRVQTHLETCPHCRAYVDDAMAMRLAFPEIEDTELPEGFHDGVMARIAAESTPAKKKPARRWWKTLAPVAAACFAVVLLMGRGGLTGGAEKAAQAPAAAAPFAFDSAAEEESCAPAAEAPAASAPAAESPSYEFAATAKSENAPMEFQKPKETTDGADPLADQEASEGEAYFTTLILTADEAEDIDFLAAMERMEFADGSSGYLLTREEYETLLSLLPDRDGAEAISDGQMAQVLIQD